MTGLHTYDRASSEEGPCYGPHSEQVPRTQMKMPTVRGTLALQTESEDWYPSGITFLIRGGLQELILDTAGDNQELKE